MKILLIGDTQIANHKAMGGPVTGGLNLRCREILEALDYQIGYARQHYGIEAVVQVGDFFDLVNFAKADERSHFRAMLVTARLSRDIFEIGIVHGENMKSGFILQEQIVNIPKVRVSPTGSSFPLIYIQPKARKYRMGCRNY
jgi:hypothetical protein